MSLIQLSDEQRQRLSDEQYAQLQLHFKLFTTGEGSDILVTCDDTTLKVHKEILCSRSKYFKAAFFKGFKETWSSQLVLQEFVSAYFVGLIVQYIYLAIPEAGYDLEVYWPMNDADFYEIFLELYRHAAFFQVQDLMNAIMKDLLKRLDKSAKILFRVHRDSADPELFKKALHETMTAAVSAFDKDNPYYDCYEPLRAEIFGFVERCHKVLSGMGDEFDDYLRRAPELSLAILKKMRHIQDSRLITPDRKVLCMFCKWPICDGRPRLCDQPEFGTVADRNGNVRYFCSLSGCFRQIRVKNCFNRD